MTQLPMNLPPMMGLLRPQDRWGALSSGLLNFGGGLLAAGAPTTDPGQGQRLLGQAFQGFGNTVNDQLQQARQNAVVRQQMEVEQAKRARAEEMRKALPGLLGGLTPQQRAVVSQMEPEAAFDLLGKRVFADPKERKIVKGADGFQYYVDDGSRVLPNVQEKPKRERFTINDGDTQRTVIGDPTDPTTWVDAATAPRYKPPGTTVNVGDGEGAFAKEAGKADAAVRDTVLNAGQAAETTLGRVRAMSAILPSIGTGPVAQKMPGLQAFFGDLGVNVSGVAERLGIDIQNVGSAEEFERLSRELSTEALSNFKGSTSNRELDFARGTVANLGKSEEGNARALAAMEVMAERAQEYSQELLRLEQEKGVSQATFNEWRNWRDAQARENPIDREVAERAKARMSSIAAPTSASDEDLLRKYGVN